MVEVLWGTLGLVGLPATTGQLRGRTGGSGQSGHIEEP